MSFALITIEHSEHPQVLKEVAAQVEFPLSKEDQNVIAEMKSMLQKINGVGLAAPQIGISKKILVYAISEEAKALRKDGYETIPPTTLINAYYEPAPNAKFVSDWEGCFSVAEKTGKVPRYDKIVYSAQNEEGTIIQGIAEGFRARVLQHEIDHIQGILIIDRLTPDCLQGEPDEMILMRFKEFDGAQKEILKKMIVKQEAELNPQDTVRTQWIAKIKKILNEEE